MKKIISVFLLFVFLLLIISPVSSYAQNKPDVLRMLPYLVASGIVFKTVDSAHNYAMYCIEKLPTDVLDKISSGFTITYDIVSSIRNLAKVHFDLGTGYIKNNYISYRNLKNPVVGGPEVVGAVFDMALSDPNLFATYGPWYYITVQIPESFSGKGDDVIQYDCFSGSDKVRAFSISHYDNSNWIVRGGTSTQNYKIVGKSSGLVRLRVRNRYNETLYRECGTGSNWYDIGVLIDYVPGSVVSSHFSDIYVDGNAGYEDISFELTADNIGVGIVLPESELEGMRVREITDVSAVIGLGVGDVVESPSYTGVLDNIFTSVSVIADALTVGLVGDVSTINYPALKNIGYNVTSKFPFSLPWDLYNSLNSLNSGYTSKPAFSLTFPNPLGESFDIDVPVPDEFDKFITFIRSSFLFMFALSLIYLTPTLLGGDK